MKSSDALYRKHFSHIYVEESLAGDPKVNEIAGRLGNPTVITVAHYKDVFNKPSQDPVMQANSRKLILAENKGTRIHSGSPYCNDFGYERFYHVSNVLNCPFDCSYCYLKGRYDSSNIVAFLNTGDFQSDLIEMSGGLDALVTLSYDSDELALEPLLGILIRWENFISENKNLEFEIRTKSTVLPPFSPMPNLTVGISMLPDEVIRAYESHTPPLGKRIAYASLLLEKGYNVRICMDPLLETEGYAEIYGRFASLIGGLDGIRDFTAGSFRMPVDYFKRMAGNHGNHFLHHYPFETAGKQVTYNKGTEEALLSSVLKPLGTIVPGDKIHVR